MIFETKPKNIYNFQKERPKRRKKSYSSEIRMNDTKLRTNISLKTNKSSTPSNKLINSASDESLSPIGSASSTSSPMPSPPSEYLLKTIETSSLAPSTASTSAPLDLSQKSSRNRHQQQQQQQQNSSIKNEASNLNEWNSTRINKAVLNNLKMFHHPNINNNNNNSINISEDIKSILFNTNNNNNSAINNMNNNNNNSNNNANTNKMRQQLTQHHKSSINSKKSSQMINNNQYENEDNHLDFPTFNNNNNANPVINNNINTAMLAAAASALIENLTGQKQFPTNNNSDLKMLNQQFNYFNNDTNNNMKKNVNNNNNNNMVSSLLNANLSELLYKFQLQQNSNNQTNNNNAFFGQNQAIKNNFGEFKYSSSSSLSSSTLSSSSSSSASSTASSPPFPFSHYTQNAQTTNEFNFLNYFKPSLVSSQSNILNENNSNPLLQCLMPNLFSNTQLNDLILNNHQNGLVQQQQQQQQQQHHQQQQQNQSKQQPLLLTTASSSSSASSLSSKSPPSFDSTDLINNDSKKMNKKLNNDSEYTSYNEIDDRDISTVTKQPNGKRFKPSSAKEQADQSSQGASNITNTKLRRNIKQRNENSPTVKLLNKTKSNESSDQMNLSLDDNNTTNSSLLETSKLPAELIIHGGFGVKNPEYDSLNNDAELLAAVEVLDDPENKYKCKICQKTFKLQRLMNRHMKNHSNIKRYLCTFCNKGFNDAFDLKRHTRTHTGVRPFQCFECDRKFTQRCSLESHLNKVHQVELSFKYKERRAKLYVCEDCGKTTEDPEKHLAHLQEMHPNSPALKRSYDRRIIKINSSNNINNNNNGKPYSSAISKKNSSDQQSSTNHSISSSVSSPFNPNMDKSNQDESSIMANENNVDNFDEENYIEEETADAVTHVNNNNNDNINSSQTEQSSQQSGGRKKSRKSPKSVIKYDLHDDDELIIDDVYQEENGDQNETENVLNEDETDNY